MKAGTKRALIHVDILIDFIYGTLPVPNGEEVVELANILTRDALKKNDPVIFLADCHDSKNLMHFKKWPIHCPKNGSGQKFHPLLLVPNGSFVIYKGTGLDDDGYSGFDNKNVEVYIVSHGKLIRLAISTLEELLDKLDVGRSDVDGLATDYCDKATAIDSTKLGYETRLIVDACRAVNINPDDGENAILAMAKAGVIMTTTDEVLHETR